MKAKITEEEAINWWLEKYHNTNLAKVMESHPEWRDNPPSHAREFYREYEVTQEQHDEWHEWFIALVMKRYRIGRKLAERRTCFDYLNISPSIKNNG